MCIRDRVGDGNNMCHSWINAAMLFDFKLTIATPKTYQPKLALFGTLPESIQLTHTPHEAVIGADAVVTDTWASMGQEEEKNARMQAFKGFCVDQKMMASANKDAIFLHCLPAYRGMEVSSDVIEGPQSAVWQEAENRLHAQKALLELLLT